MGEIMEMQIIILLISGVLLLVGTIGFIIKTFSESFLWGLACMFIPFAWIFFIIKTGKGGGYAMLSIVAILLLMFTGVFA